MRLGLQQSARLEQRLIQSPQMIQAMQILQLPTLDLSERIEQELVENPFLELAQETDTPAEPQGEPAESDHDGDDAGSMLELFERLERDFGDGGSGEGGGTPRARAEEGDRKYEAMQNAPSAPSTLAEALESELAFLRLDGDGRAILDYVVYSLDERGYLQASNEELAAELEKELQREVDPEEVELAIEQLRQATHPAIAARDLRECLLLQLDARGETDPLLCSIVADHLADVEHNRLPRIARATGRSVEEVKQAIEALRHLDPSPGSAYGGACAETITPDVIVEEVDGEYQVRLERERVPRLVISPTYKKLLGEARRGDGVREWVKKRLESARWFIDAIEQRQSTLERIAQAIFKHQRGFLDRGPAGLVPLRMQEIADEVGVHISTVSRAVSGKYAQTPRGIYPLKYFFTGGTAKTTGEMASQVSIKERIRQLVDAEDKEHPLSDDQISAMLAEKDGIQIARRTVTKYRKALSIPSSTQRREY